MKNSTWGEYQGKVLDFRFENSNNDNGQKTAELNLDDPTSVKPPYYHPAEKQFISAMDDIARIYGKLEDYDEKGIWVGYETRAQNENYSKGIRCENCAHYESEKVCMIIKRAIEPGGYCRFAAIPSEKVTVKNKNKK
jgi:hypothetical protein